ncbi:hypothetical protein MKX01_021258 [Papaver californicum]|nr:hypothetical protein MKX01_021258 [Papaver californicum]
MAAVAATVVPSISSKLSTSSSSKQPTILNYRPAIILPGLGNNSSDYEKLQMTLKQVYGVPSVVPKVSRLDWLRNAAGLVDPNYWRGTLRPRPVLDWYLERTHEAVCQAMLLAQEADEGGGCVSLVGHFAGGWLARLYMEEFGTSNIPYLIYSSPCRRTFEEATLPDKTTSTSIATETTTRSRVVGQGYKQVCGKADVWGDGVVPEVSAHLEGAMNITLDGVYHSPVGSDDTHNPWYGSPAVVEKWIHHLLT